MACANMTAEDMTLDIAYWARNFAAPYLEAYCVETREVIYRGFDAAEASRVCMSASDGVHARHICADSDAPGLYVDPHTRLHYDVRVESHDDRVARLLSNHRPVHTSPYYRV